MDSNKTITLPIITTTICETTLNKNKRIRKDVLKRQITKTKKWTFNEEDIQYDKQINHLYDLQKQSFIYQQIRNKLSGYRSQDIKKGLFVIEDRMDVSGVLQKMELAKGLCFYCKSPVFILYDNVREPRQWTLERLDNKIGHIYDNIEIACLCCNLRRRTMKYEKYIMTKQIQYVHKLDSV
jgi:hypothetical protein